MDINIDSIIQASNDRSISEAIVKPFHYLEGIPGNNQNIRSKFLVAFNSLYYKIPYQELLDSIETIIAIFHNSSLLIDDIEDSSNFRRGLPTAHTKYGVPLTINCGNLMYFIALQKAQVELPELYLSLIKSTKDVNIEKLKFETSQILIDEMLNLHQGQGLDIYWRDNLNEIRDNLPKIEDYLQMVKDKTGGLFRLSIKLLELYSPIPIKSNIIPIANLLGIIYQIRDDYLNLVDTKYSHMKGISGEDLIEGKLSLPILHCLRTTDASPVHKILYEIKSSDDRQTQTELVEECIHFMKHKSKSLEFTHDLIKSYEKIVIKLIVNDSKIDDPQSSLLIQIIERICNI